MYDWILFLMGLFGAFLILVRIYIVTRDISSIPNLFSLVWSLNILANLTLLNGTIRVTNYTLIILISAWWLFLVGCALVMKRPSLNTNNIVIVRQKAIMMLYTLFFLHIVSFLVQTKYSGSIVYQGPSQLLNTLASLRVSREANLEHVPWFLQPFSSAYIYYIPLALMLFRKGWLSAKKLIFICGSALIMSLVHFTRAPFLNTIVVLLVSMNVLYPRKRRQIVLGGIFAILAGLTLFYIMQRAIFEVTHVHMSYQQIIAPYMGAPMKAYDYMLHGQYVKSQDGLYSFDMINYVLKKVGMINSYPDLVREYIYYPVVTNVYTFLDAYTLDFGVAGVLLGSLGLGLLCGYFYNLKEKGRFFGITIYALVSYYVSISGMNNEFIRFSFLLLLVMTYVINLFVSRRFTSSKKVGSRHENSLCLGATSVR